VARHIAVLIDHHHLVRLVPLVRGATGKLNLTTILRHQPRAIVELFLVSGTQRTPLHVFETDAYDAAGQRPSLVLSAHVRERVEITLRVNGEAVAAVVKDLRTSRGGAPVVWILGAFLIVAAVLGALRLWGPLRPAGPPEEVRSAAPEPSAARDDAAPEPSAPRDDAEPAPAARDVPPATTPEADAAPAPTAGAGDAPPAPPQDVAETPERPDAMAAFPVEAVVHFDPDSAELVPAARQELDRLAQLVRDAASADGAITVTASGHTAPFPTAAWRERLSGERAAAVAAYLQARLPDATAETEARGSTQPVTWESDEQWRNRRVEIQITLQSTPR
jgi:outer membrane protein OmpA-like peptidoglycan-associated protein